MRIRVLVALVAIASVLAGPVLVAYSDSGVIHERLKREEDPPRPPLKEIELELLISPEEVWLKNASGSIAVTAEADGGPASGVDITLIDENTGQRIGRIATNEGGTGSLPFNLTRDAMAAGSAPSGIRGDESDLLSLPRVGRHLIRATFEGNETHRASEATATLLVYAKTRVNLKPEATVAEVGKRFRIEANLTSDIGPLPDRKLYVFVNETYVMENSTDSTGRSANAWLPPPESVGRALIRISSAPYEEFRSSANETLILVRGPRVRELFPPFLPLLLLILVIPGLGYLIYRRRGGTLTPPPPEGEPTPPAFPGTEQIRAHSDSPKDMVIWKYLSLISWLRSKGIPVDRRNTHWQIYREASAKLQGRTDSLRAITELFELAYFSGHPVSEGDAEMAQRYLNEITGGA